MYTPIAIDGARVETITLDPIMDAPTAPHCDECGETRSLGECHNVNCDSAGRRASRGSSPASAPRAWTLGGRVD